MIFKFLKKFSLFLITMIPLYFFLVVIWAFYVPQRLSGNLLRPINGYLNRRIVDIQGRKNIDILFVGPSTTYRGIDPRIFKKAGYDIFNLGSSSQTPKQTNILLREYIDGLNPKLVIYDVYPGVMRADGIEPSLDIIANGQWDLRYLELLWEDPNIKILNAIILKGFTTFFDVKDPDVDKDVEFETYVPGGFVESEISYNKNLIGGTTEWNLRKDQLAKLKENLKLITDKNFNYLMIRIPQSQKKINAVNNEEYVDSLYSSLGNFKNFQYSVNIFDKKDFMDPNHLNQNGVGKFNKALIKYLDKNYPELKSYPTN